MIDRCCISLSDCCNLKCKYCHFQDKKRGTSSFEKKEVFFILENIHKYCERNNIKTFKIGIVGSGEPMLRKELIFDMLDYVTDRKFSELRMYTVTNGTLLTAEDIKKFFCHREIIRLCFSLDGYEELHNYGRSRYSVVMDSIATYKSIFHESPFINATVNAISIKNKERLIDFFTQNNLLNVTFSKLVGYSGQDLFISNKDFLNFMEYVKNTPLISRQFRLENKYDCTMYGKLCGVGRTNIFITPKGIYPCGRFYENDSYLLGNYRDSLFEIEKNMNELLVPIEDGKCYYEQYVEGKK